MEFMNSKMYCLCNAYGITIRSTSSYNPAQNGLCECRHALIDKIIVKMLMDNSKLDLQVFADLACLAKNAEVGYSS